MDARSTNVRGAYVVTFVGSSLLWRIHVAAVEWIRVHDAHEVESRAKRQANAKGSKDARSRRADAVDPTTPQEIQDPFAYIARLGRDELLRAADLGSRLTVVALLFSVMYYAVDANMVGPNPQPLDLAEFRRDYIDYALLVGPVLGLVWWGAESQYADAARKAVRERHEGRLDTLPSDEAARRFGGSQGLVSGLPCLS